MHDSSTVSVVRAALAGGPIPHGARHVRHAEIARSIRMSATDRDLVADPRTYAAGLNLRLVELSPVSPVPVLANIDMVLYQPHPDPRREGWRILIGVAEAELCRRGPHAPTDLWLVVAGLAVPASMRSASVGILLERQRWAPEWFLRLARLSVAA